MCNVLNFAHDGSSDHGAVRRVHGSKKEKKGSSWLSDVESDIVMLYFTEFRTNITSLI
jgi:hypothetical protein